MTEMNSLDLKRMVCLIFAVLLLLVNVHVLAAAPGPTDQLKPALDNLIAILDDNSLKGEEKKAERRIQIMAAISSGFDFREMSKRVLGQTWNTINAKERDYFVSLMTKLLENVYVGKLETYTGQQLEFVAERIKGNRAQVTTLIEDQGVKLPVHYIMQEVGHKWMVYDINIEGVSLIRNYMEQFKSILRTDGFEGLVKVIEEKNRNFAD